MTNEEYITKLKNVVKTILDQNQELKAKEEVKKRNKKWNKLLVEK